MIAKVIAHGRTRDEARERLARALDETVVLGVPTNKAFLAAVLRDADFAAQGATTDFLQRRFAVIPAAEPVPATLATAAALLAAQANYGEWNSWSNNPAHAMRLRLRDHDIALHHDQGLYRITIGEAEISVRILSVAAPFARTAIDGIEETVTFAIGHRGVHLARAGLSHNLADTTHAPPTQRAAVADGRLIAPMSGRVIAVHAKAGETAEPGQTLVVIEAMKMEHALSTRAGARITAVHVAPGAQVSPGQLLVELEAT